MQPKRKTMKPQTQFITRVVSGVLFLAVFTIVTRVAAQDAHTPFREPVVEATFAPLSLIATDMTLEPGVQVNMNPWVSFEQTAGVVYADWTSGMAIGGVLRSEWKFTVNRSTARERNQVRKSYIGLQAMYKAVSYPNRGDWFGQNSSKRVFGAHIKFGVKQYNRSGISIDYYVGPGIRLKSGGWTDELFDSAVPLPSFSAGFKIGLGRIRSSVRTGLKADPQF